MVGAGTAGRKAEMTAQWIDDEYLTRDRKTAEPKPWSEGRTDLT